MPDETLDTSFDPELYERQAREEAQAKMTAVAETLDTFVANVPLRVRESPKFQAWVAELKIVKDGETTKEKERRLKWKMQELYG